MSTNAFKTGDIINNIKYAFTNQFAGVRQKHCRTPERLNLDIPRIKHVAYIKIKKNKIWYINAVRLLSFGLIPKYPEMRTKTFTQQIERDWMKTLVIVDVGLSFKSHIDGTPKEKKSE